MNVRWLPPRDDANDDDASLSGVPTSRSSLRALPIESGGPSHCIRCGRFVASTEELCDRCAAGDGDDLDSETALVGTTSAEVPEGAFASEVAWVFERTRHEFVIPRPSELHRVEDAPVTRDATHLPAEPTPIRRPADPPVGIVPVPPPPEAAVSVSARTPWVGQDIEASVRATAANPEEATVARSSDRFDDSSAWATFLSAATEPRWIARVVIVLAVLLGTAIPLLTLR